ncbi:PTS sugar transporter subunit IIA [uncultured Mitsuokella sp.]|uniref:BglG family transcription antiterminator n=1 Tax=uncultured Mitsuokella sp. TaxID=453120 RepID=UPI002608CC88|nr:PTS sugar transporter subunit IIA [uncultured Mitsuokella sp.]
MKLTRRQIRAVQCLYEHSEWGIREIGAKLGVSPQTVRSDFMQTKELMESYRVRIQWLSGNRIRLIGMEHVGYMLKEFQKMQDFSLEKQAILLLLLHDRFIILQDMADMLFVSKSLMEKIMSGVLKKYGNAMESVRHHGIRVCMPHIERRNAFVELVMPYCKGVDFRNELLDFHTNHFPLLQYVSTEDVARALKTIRKVRESESFGLTDESISQLFLQMIYVAFCRRAFAPFHLEFVFHAFVKEGQDTSLYLRAARETCACLALPEEERDYFAYLFMILRKQVISDASYYIAEMHDAMMRILSRIHARLAIDFHGDQTLLEGLAVHLYTTVIRRNHLKTAFLENEGNGIRQAYPIGMEMAVLAAQVIRENFSYTVSDEEIVYLTLHFQAALERMKSIGQTLRVLVVCHYGMAAASLISARLEHHNAGMKVIGCMSMQTFMETASVDADLIVSTESIQQQEGLPPILYVTPMLPEREIRQLQQFAETHCCNNILMLYLSHAAILPLREAASAEDVIHHAAHYLVTEGCVSEAYAESLLERERTSATDLENIAVPHGNPDYVKQTRLVIVRLEKPILWHVSMVQYVFIFAVCRTDLKERFGLVSSFYKRLARSAVREGLRHCEGLDETSFRLEVMHLMGS